MFDFSWLVDCLRVIGGHSRRLCHLLVLLTLTGLFVPRALAQTGAEPAQTLTVAFDARPRSVDPRFVATDANSQYLEPLLFLPLFGFTEKGAPQGILAENYRYTDPKTLIVHIREGIRFAFGREVGVEDVVATYAFILGQTPRGTLPPSPRQGVFERVQSVVKVSEREVKFTLREPDASLVSNLVVGILPKESMNQAQDEIFNGKGFESGPFVLESFNDTEWILKRNQNYSGAPFGGAFPRLLRVVFKILTDNNTRYASLLKGDVDLVQNGLDVDKVSEFYTQRSAEFQTQLRTADSTTFLAFNLKNKLLSDLRVRRAIGLAIDREEILKFTLQGSGRLADSMFPPEHPFHFENKKPLRKNIREAELLLDSAGYRDPDGTGGPRPRAEFTIKVPLNRERIAIAKAIAGQLKKVGLKVKVEILEFNMFMKHLNDGNMQAWIAPWTGYKDGDHLHFVFHSSCVPPRGANRGNYINPQVDRLLDKAKSESNQSVRNELYQRAQLSLAEDLPYVFLWHRLGHVVTRKGISGFKIYPDGRYSSLTVTEKR